jgi:large subunit ribosomal protein L15
MVESKTKSASGSKTSATKTTKKSDEKETILRLHHLKPAKGAVKERTRVGRGEASKGKTSGRGTKGTKARYQVPQRFEGGQMPLHMRLPKVRGFRNINHIEYQVVNLDAISKAFKDGSKVDIAALVEKGLVRKNQPVKLLANGEITGKYTISVDKASATAISKVEAKGGSVEVLIVTPNEDKPAKKAPAKAPAKVEAPAEAPADTTEAAE